MEISDLNSSKNVDASIDNDFRARLKNSAKLLSNLANETRLRTIYLLASRGEMFVGELVSEIGISQSALSQHLAKLREAGIIATRRDAQKHFYSLQHDWMRDLLTALDAVYTRNLPQT
ncbi:ArsR/SmtB family transcription factor [Rhizobium multihospitium]|uniref:DNA-binding transcriptional regulator, ArsR family n=1 Tax=Rhizobium multihospitium TaxID=410764 RepID=A0A1C3X4P1_9HYPH|nr:metalloregulator ArsR/SmtB family transcription factor [Rhizobium multihospitium]NRP90540.1 Transcriptional activator HlyU [Ensifer adhaerens]SCB47199.1 DNA-binding transcriptional regulator, ArsR family [Rhizobium multihospitium]